jgi:hypothetical protein
MNAAAVTQMLADPDLSIQVALVKPKIISPRWALAA